LTCFLDVIVHEMLRIVATDVVFIRITIEEAQIETLPGDRRAALAMETIATTEGCVFHLTNIVDDILEIIRLLHRQGGTVKLRNDAATAIAPVVW
jgi:hypothetical protein